MNDNVNQPNPPADALDTAAPGETPEGLTLEQLQAELDKARAQAAEYLDGWQRARAEFINFKKRVEREREDHGQSAYVDVLKKLLPAMDDFNRALDNQPQDLQDHAWAQGIALVGQKFNTIFETYGMREIDPLGEAFDPNLHEAIGVDAGTETESGHVTVVLQKGYVYGDRVVRPALVGWLNNPTGDGPLDIGYHSNLTLQETDYG